MSFGRLGSLGRGFGRLGSGRGATSATPVSGVLPANGGSYVWSGDTMTPLVDYKLPATGGSYAWTGQDATLTATSSDAAETTAFLARTSGLSGTETQAYKDLINGLVADSHSDGGSIFSHLDGLWIATTKDKTTFNLNLIQNNYNLTESGSTFTFVADDYVSPDDLFGYMTTGLVPSSFGGNFAQNSACLFAYQFNSRGSATATCVMATEDGSSSSLIQLNVSFGSPPNAFYDVNMQNFPAYADAATQGFWLTTRVAASGAGAVNFYKNGNTTPVATNTGASVSLPTNELKLMNGNSGSRGPAGDRFGAFGIGGRMSATDQQKISNRINAFMTAFGKNVY
jgi:hypothetical protein